jgi:hypothetical protein
MGGISLNNVAQRKSIGVVAVVEFSQPDIVQKLNSNTNVEPTIRLPSFVPMLCYALFHELGKLSSLRLRGFHILFYVDLR